MADIKTKDTKKGTIKAIDKASVATQRMKQTYIASKEKAENAVKTDKLISVNVVVETVTPVVIRIIIQIVVRIIVNI